MNLPNNPTESVKVRNPHLYQAVEHRRIRQCHRPLLNELEKDYLRHLEQQHGCKINSQAVKLMLANGHWYKPDFIVITPTSDVLAIEVKGPHAFRGGYENLKVAAHTYTWITFKLVWKEQGQWQVQTVLP